MKICYTGGGTAGHIIPALSVSQALRKTLAQGHVACEEFWLSSESQKEIDMINQGHIRTIPVPSGKLRRYISLQNIKDLFKVLKAIGLCKKILKEERPDVLFSKGGFVSVPPVIAASRLGIPCITHESDATVGLATKINARFVDTVCVAHDEVALSLSPTYRSKVVVTGNPVRQEMEMANVEAGRNFFNIPEDMPVLLVLGGSQGALQINELVWASLDRLCEHAFVIHQTGEKTYRAIQHEKYLAVPFIDKSLCDIMAAATVVVSRAGAGTLAELCYLGKPMLLVPLGTNASRGDQILNAQRLQALGAAIVLQGEGLEKDCFANTVCSLLEDRDRCQALGSAASVAYERNASDKIAQVILKACNIDDYQAV